MRVPRDEELLGLFRTALMPVAFCSADVIEHANPHFASLLGYSDVEDVIGRHPIDDVVVPAARDGWRDVFDVLLTGEMPYVPYRCDAERRDGSTLPVFIRGQGYDTPDGRRVFLAVVDDTEESQDRHLLNILRLAVDRVSEALLVVRATGHSVYANRAAEVLFEAQPGALFGHDTIDFVVDRATDNFARYRADLAETRRATAEIELRTLRDRTFPARVTTARFEDPGTGESLTMAVIHDVAEERAVAEERELREKQLATMLREAHHRIKNTLQVATDVLALQSVSSESDEVRSALKRASTRIRALSAVHEGISTHEDVTTVPLRPLVQTVLNNLRDSIMLSPRQVAIEASVDDLRGTSREASAIALITTELVTNALTHGNATTIGVRFTVTDQDACLSVTDDGEGEVRPDEMLRSRKLGLQLVALLAEEQLGGSFEITRTDAQTSATVRFTLEPAQADAPTPDAS